MTRVSVPLQEADQSASELRGQCREARCRGAAEPCHGLPGVYFQVHCALPGPVQSVRPPTLTRFFPSMASLFLYFPPFWFPRGQGSQGVGGGPITPLPATLFPYLKVMCGHCAERSLGPVDVVLCTHEY